VHAHIVSICKSCLLACVCYAYFLRACLSLFINTCKVKSSICLSWTVYAWWRFTQLCW